MAFQLNYDEMIILDAEDLAETGIKKAYDSLLPKLREYVPQPQSVEEHFDHDVPSYSVISGDKEFMIYAPELEEGEGHSWGRATYALFATVNEQLAKTGHRFYAINGGNELGGIFLTQDEVERAKRSLPEKRDWPYLPTQEHPWYGQHH
jgi:hypothetical protein